MLFRHTEIATVDETVGVIEIGEEVTDARGPEIGVIGETDAQDQR